MFIFKNSPTGFIHIPKTAGTTLIDSAEGHHSNRELRKKYPTYKGSAHHNKYSYFESEGMTADLDCFTLVRNPWARALSLFLFTIKHTAETISEMPSQAKVHARLCLEGFRGAWMPGGFFDRDHARDNTGKEILRQWDSSDSQLSWLKNLNGDIACKWYKIEEDIGQVEDNYPCSMGGNAVRTQTKHGHYSLYYDEELKDRVGELFKEDVETFGYEFVNNVKE
jgi:hypothetical protein